MISHGFIHACFKSDIVWCLRNIKMADKFPMEYRHLGPTGLKVSIISLGNWINANTE